MTGETDLFDFVARWEAAREKGFSLTLGEICRERPELIDAVRSAIWKLHGKDALESVANADETQSFIRRVEDQPTPGSRYRVGQQVAGFRLIREIGHGGFGEVFEAEDPKLLRKVAIKLLSPKAVSRPGMREQFLGEARSMAALQHDHVVPIYQVGEVDGHPFLVMPLLVGETLADRLSREGSLPPEETRRIGRELCLGLAALHAKGLIHRDIKPANIWLEISTGRVKLLDLGLADEAANLRAAGSAGTPAYMSPEQVDGLELDFRSDLFSVGAVLYECVTGRRAFPGQNLTEIFDAVRRAQPVPVRQANPGVPADLVELITRLLSKDRAARPASAREVVERLTPVQTTYPPRLPLGKWRVGLGALLVILIGVAAIVAVTRRGPGPTTPPPVAPPTTPVPPLAIDSLQVIPWQVTGDRLDHPLPPLGARDQILPTTANAIEVEVRLSRPAYSYILLYRSDGQDTCLFPQDDTDVPPLTDRPRYPSKRPEARYVLDDGPGIWAVAVVACDQPLPCYRDWRQLHSPHPWQPQTDPQRLTVALLDDGLRWRGLGISETYSRGEKRFKLHPYQQLVDWLKERIDGGEVKAVAFPVRPRS